MRSLLLVLVLLATGAVASTPPQEGGAGERAYLSALLYSPDSVDAMSMRCRPTASARNSLREVECVFSQILVTRRPPSTAGANEEAAVRKRYGGVGGVEKARASCREWLAYLDEVQAVNKEPSKVAYLARERSELQKLCACESVDCIVAATRGLHADPNACSVTHSQFERVFRREAKHKWVSVSGPDGICDIVLTVVLTYDPKSESWAYTQTRVVTSDDATCKGFASTTVAYSHHLYMRNALMNCETITTLLP